MKEAADVGRDLAQPHLPRDAALALGGVLRLQRAITARAAASITGSPRCPSGR